MRDTDERTHTAQIFRMASGDTWPSSLPILDEEGSINYRTCLFLCTFVVVVVWVRVRVRW